VIQRLSLQSALPVSQWACSMHVMEEDACLVLMHVAYSGKQPMAK
jgi:hypothetical protein